LSLIPVSTGAQTACGERDAIAQRLRAQYDERQVAVGMTSMGNLVEIFASPEGKTWTALLTQANGFACITAVGEDWGTVQPAPEVPGDAT